MFLHFMRITIITILILALIFLPYMPGEYDASAVTLSGMAQLVGFSSLLLVPPGIAWLIHEKIKQRKKGPQTSNKTYHFAIAALIVSGFVALIPAFGAFINHNHGLAIVILLIYILIVSRIISKLKQIKIGVLSSFNPTPYYLICIPVLVILIRSMFIGPAVEFSRNYVIEQSENYIRDIEAYYTRNGHYPGSLLSLHSDYDPAIRGIKRFHYEVNGNAYNIYFEQFSNELGIREIVMYNKLGEHEMTSHDMDLLQLSPEEQNRQRGYHLVNNLPQKNWKYFWFD